MELSPTNRINLLPEHLIDQIKAGEVVERPANVLKELLENSIDSKPTEIKITIKENGLDLIAVEDNGLGMYFDELPYAFCRHATSKIISFEDIYKLNTFGFRGEALASISSVSRISCHSAPRDNLAKGAKFVIHGAQAIEHSPYHPNVGGTSIFVKDLFYNTPVRLKFVKSKISEKNAIKRILNAFLIANPTIKFTISIDDLDREIYNAVSFEDKSSRISEVFSGSKRKYTIFSGEDSYVRNRVKIYFTKESTKGNTGKHHFLFVNDRLFTDKKLHQVVVRNLEKFWPYGETGHFVIDLKVPEDEIDVNVHPNKTLIKFLNEVEAFALVSASIKKVMASNTSVIETQELIEDTEQSPLENILNSPLWMKVGSEANENSPLTSTQFGQANLFSNSSQESITSFGANIFCLEQEDHSIYLLNAEIALCHALNSLSLKSEVETTPLLISEPYTYKNFENEDSLLNDLNSYGIEIDRIDNFTLVLRTIPTIIEDFNYVDIINDILAHSIKSSKVTIENFSNTNLNLNVMSKLFKGLGIIELIKIGCAKKISGKKLKTIFYENK